MQLYNSSMPYNDYSHSVQTVGIDSTWLIISAILAIVGGIVAYVLFVSKKNEGEYSGFLSDLHDFLNFKKYFIEVILKVMYLITAIFITLGSFSFIGTSVALFFLMIIVGNITARISYELILMMLTIVNNTSEINKKLSQKNVQSTGASGEEKRKKKISKTEEDEK